MSAEAHRAGHAILALLWALGVTAAAIAVSLTLVMIGDEIASGHNVYVGEVLSSLVYLLVLAGAIAVAFGTVPFVGMILLLMRFRIRSIAAFAAGGIAAGLIAATAFLLIVSADSIDVAMDELRKYLFEDLTGAAVLLSCAIGAVAAQRYLVRRDELGA